MQTDMHYYATYAMARSAGFREDIARTIATAAEYVDDSDEVDVTCTDGVQIFSEATAHHPLNFPANLDAKDQKRTWVPFHFIPGCEGDTLEERLVCKTDSKIAQRVVAHTLDNLHHRYGTLLLGILAHSYVDTFSHYGFSGIASSLNKIETNSYKFECTEPTKNVLSTKFTDFFNKFAVGPMANSVMLGHGSVATYPDQPFLTWEFMYSNPRRASGMRVNQETFLQGCRRLHETFVLARDKFNNIHDDEDEYRDFADMENAIKEILAVEGDDKVRTAAWQRAATAGRIYRKSEPIPEYNSGMFTKDLMALANYDEEFAKSTVVFQFLQAAELHRDHILNVLLPAHGVNIESANIEWHSKGPR